MRRRRHKLQQIQRNVFRPPSPLFPSLILEYPSHSRPDLNGQPRAKQIADTTYGILSASNVGMRRTYDQLQYLAITAIAVTLLSAGFVAPAQIGIALWSGAVCPYGYFDYPTYSCAPYGYYGPDWFVGRLFIGPGRGFMGRAAFTAMWQPLRSSEWLLEPMPERGEQSFTHSGKWSARRARPRWEPGHDAGNEHSAGFAGADVLAEAVAR